MDKSKYDFAGWVTKSNVVCSDGVTIMHDAFQENDGTKVPLVWNHNYDNPTNVIGHMILEHRDEGVYGYGHFNDSEYGTHAKGLVDNREISALSIGARKLKRNGSNLIHGLIYEVSLVMAGANPGAMIETVVKHSDTGEEEGLIYTDNLIHSISEIETILMSATKEKKAPAPKPEPGTKTDPEEKTIEQVIDTMNEEQQQAVYALIGMAIDTASEDPGQNEDKKNDEGKKQDDEKGDEENMKHNVFNKGADNKKEEQMKANYEEVLTHALNSKAPSLKDMLLEKDETLTHGINSIEMLFPEAYQSTNGNTPILYKDTNTAYEEILSMVNKSPFSRVKTLVADLTEEEARAKGYIKGNMKKEEFFSLIKRLTQPTTVYKKQKLDRDDLIDITDFDVVAFMNVEMQMMLKEEIARAVLVGDGRDFSSEDKIDEQHIRPVISDNEFFTIHKGFAAIEDFIEAVITAMAEYRGSGRPNMYIDPTLLSAVKLLKANDGRFLFGDIPSDEAIANRLGLNKIVATTFMSGKGALIVNLRDYTIGATKGGQVTNFDDFDIDFNQHKYLIETRLSGALTLPKSAIHLQQGTAGTGVADGPGGITRGKRQADKTPDPEE